MAVRRVPLILVLLLLVVQAQLWFGRGSVPNVAQLESRLQAQSEKNALARQANDRLASEVRDLKEGMEMVEDKARFELGMVKPDEIFVQVTTR